MPWEKVVKLVIELLYKTTATNTFSPTPLFSSCFLTLSVKD